MFHRVKSETEDQDMDVQTPEKPAEEEASVQTSLLKEEATEQPKNVYQRVGSSATVRQGVQYSSKPATSTSYKAPTAPSKPTAPAQKEAPKAAATKRPSAEASADIGDRTLTIGRGITMSGEIDSCDKLHVEGTVEAALKGAAELNIAESGVFYGTVEIEEATIAGRFEGEIIVNGRLTIESTGVIAGSISYRDLEVESGAVIDGRITPLAAEKSAHVPASEEDAA